MAQATSSELKVERCDSKAYVFSLQSSAHLWHHYEHREAYQKLLEDIAVLRRLAARLSSRAEMVGAIRQVRTSWCLTHILAAHVHSFSFSAIAGGNISPLNFICHDDRLKMFIVVSDKTVFQSGNRIQTEDYP